MLRDDLASRARHSRAFVRFSLSRARVLVPCSPSLLSYPTYRLSLSQVPAGVGIASRCALRAKSCLPIAHLTSKCLPACLQEEEREQREEELRRKAEEQQRQARRFAAEEARLREEATRLEEEEEMLDTTALTAAALGALQVDRCRATLASAWQQLTAIFHRRTLCRSLDLPLYVTPSSPPSPCAHCAAAPATLHQGTTVPLAEDPNIYGSMLGVLASPEHTESNVSFSLQEPPTSPTAGGPLKMMSTRSFPVRMISVKSGRVACKSLAL